MFLIQKGKISLYQLKFVTEQDKVVTGMPLYEKVLKQSKYKKIKHSSYLKKGNMNFNYYNSQIMFVIFIDDTLLISPIFYHVSCKPQVKKKKGIKERRAKQCQLLLLF